MQPENFAWIILLLPLLATVVITLFTQRHANLSARISIVAVLGAFGISLAMFFLFRESKHVPVEPFEWLTVANFKVELGLQLDPLSLLMLLIVTGAAWRRRRGR